MQRQGDRLCSLTQVRPAPLQTFFYGDPSYTLDYKRAPFALAGEGLSSSQALSWFYLDPKNIVRGPFSSELMDKKFRMGFFFDQIKISLQKQNKAAFLPVRDFVTDSQKRRNWLRLLAEEN